MCLRENPDITQDEVGNLIGLKEEGHFDQIEKEILYFYTRRSRKDIIDHFQRVHDAAKAVEEATEEATEQLTKQLEVEKSGDPSESPEEQQKENLLP